MKAKVIVINGLPCSGKDTFVDFCIAEAALCNRVGKISTVDYVKELANYCGWDGVKTSQSRKFLSDLKNALTEWDDIPFKKLVEAIDDFEKGIYYRNLARGWSKSFLHDPIETDGVIFIMCREPKEIQRIKERFNAKTLLIDNSEVRNNAQSNSTDANVYNYTYDYIINNNGTLEELRNKARQFLTIIGLKIERE